MITGLNNTESAAWLKSLLAPFCYIALQLLLFPFFDLPVDDDFSYLRSLENLRNGELNLLGWTSMPLIGQLLLGLPFAELIDNIFLASRVSSIFYMSLGLYVISYIINQYNPKYNWLPVILIFQPDLLMSYYYMTDGYFAIAMIISILLAKRRLFIWSIIVFLLATSIRDISVVFVPLFAWYAWKEHGFSKSIPITVFYIGAFFLVSVGFREYLLSEMGALPELYDHGRERLSVALEKGVIAAAMSSIRSLFAGLVYLGLSLLPFTILSNNNLSIKKVLSLILGITVLCLGFLMVIPEQTYTRIVDIVVRYFSILQFWEGNYFYLALDEAGVGFISILLISVIGFSSIVLSISSLIFQDKKGSFLSRIKENPEIIAIAIYCLVLAPAGYFARYMIMPYLIIALLMIINSNSSISFAGIKRKGIIFLFLVHSFMVNKAYINMKYTTQSLIEKAETLGANPENMDAGFEYNGYNNYQEGFKEIVPGKWWWVKGDKYIVYHVIPNTHSLIDQQEVFTYLPLYTKLKLGVRDKE